MYGMQGAAAYGRVDVESEVLSASPHRLIEMLFEHVLRWIRTAKVHLQDGDLSAKGEAIGKALDIVNQGLLAAVDKEKGGALAERLEELYLYTAEQLLQANLHNQPRHLDNAERVLNELASGWQDVAHP